MPSGAASGRWPGSPGRPAAASRRPSRKQPTGDAIRRAIEAALAAAKLESFDVGHVNAHGNSTLEDDRAEAQAIRRALGDVPVTAPKSFFGNLGHGSGAVELAVSLVALGQGRHPAHAQLRDARPGMPGERGRPKADPGRKPHVRGAEPQHDRPAAAAVVTRCETWHCRNC